MSKNPTIQDRLEELELQLCDARIAVEQTVANNEPLAIQELATLQADRVELQMSQEMARASKRLQDSDLVLHDLELALLSRRIDCATLAVNGAHEAQRRLADLQLKRATLLLSQHKKRLQHPTPSSTSPSASAPTTVSSSDSTTRSALSPSQDSAPAETSFDFPSGLSPPTPLCPSPSSPASPVRDSSLGDVLSTAGVPGVPADKAIEPNANDHDEDAHDTGDVERELIGENTRQRASVDRGTPKLREDSTTIIDIDDDGVARDLIPLHGQSHRKSSDAFLQADSDDDATAPGDEEASFMFVGSPRAPRAVLEARANKSSSPLKALIEARGKKSGSPQNASPRSAAKPHKAVASTRKSGGYKEPTAFPPRWMFRVLNFGAASLRASSDWPDSVCREVAVLWAAVISWETRNEFKDGTVKAPAQSPLMGTIVSKSRFGPSFHDVIKKEPDFSASVARCIDSLRHSTLAEVAKMHGTHGLTAVARALLEAYSSDEYFADFFIPLARELTTVLNIVSAVPPSRTDDDDSDSDGDDDDSDDQVVDLTGTVLEALNVRDGYDAAPATRAIQALVALAGDEKKRDASHLDAEAGPSKRARRSLGE
ncbi:unnamed protein product [Peniophora sp. CBMAI 1063]|nr:unnamed protein product [Peniophora sp. CBMAI 1063]